MAKANPKSPVISPLDSSDNTAAMAAVLQADQQQRYPQSSRKAADMVGYAWWEANEDALAAAEEDTSPAAELVSAQPDKRDDAIHITADQVDLYRNHDLTLVGPGGEVIDIIAARSGGGADPDNLDDARNLLHLLECLVVNQQGGLELTERASAGLADTLLHAQQLLE